MRQIHAIQIPLAAGKVTELLRRPGYLLVREHGSGAVTGIAVQQAERADDEPAVLVRPDGYISWAGTRAVDAVSASGGTAAYSSSCLGS